MDHQPDGTYTINVFDELSGPTRFVGAFVSRMAMSLDGAVPGSGKLVVEFYFSQHANVQKKAKKRPEESRSTPEGEAAREAAREKAEAYERVGREAREAREAREREREAREKGKGSKYQGRNAARTPRPEQAPMWLILLGFPTTRKDAEKAYRKLAQERHPDRGGTHEEMVELNAAIESARKVLK